MLSERERVVVERVADGKTTRSIAREMGISEEAVARDLARVSQAVGANNRTHLIAILYRLGVLELDRF